MSIKECWWIDYKNFDGIGEKTCINCPNLKETDNNIKEKIYKAIAKKPQDNSVKSSREKWDNHTEMLS
jgi:hypothetical protein